MQGRATSGRRRSTASHLRLLNIPVGLLINFHVLTLRDGIKRMVNNYREPIGLVI
jgi:hypothetical protein